MRSVGLTGVLLRGTFLGSRGEAKSFCLRGSLGERRSLLIGVVWLLGEMKLVSLARRAEVGVFGLSSGRVGRRGVEVLERGGGIREGWAGRERRLREGEGAGILVPSTTMARVWVCCREG